MPRTDRVFKNYHATNQENKGTHRPDREGGGSAGSHKLSRIQRLPSHHPATTHTLRPDRETGGSAESQELLACAWTTKPQP